jgi:homoserine kinase type II
LPRATENTNFLLHTTDRGIHPDALREARRPKADLPFFLGLMQHLAEQGHFLPPAGRRATTGAVRHAFAGRPAAIITFLEGMWLRKPRSCIAARSAARWPNCISPAGTLTMTRPNSLAIDGWRKLWDAVADRADEVEPGLQARVDADFAEFEKNWPKEPAVGRHPRRPVPGQCVLPRRRPVGPDRLLFRLQRPATPTTSPPASMPGASRRIFPST